jgi:hypothetical protein
VTEDAFLSAANATGTFVRAAPGFLSRRLSRGENGLWTDHVIWSGMAEAKAAAEAIMTESAVAPFLDAIDPASVAMRHDRVALQMG